MRRLFSSRASRPRRRRLLLFLVVLLAGIPAALFLPRKAGPPLAPLTEQADMVLVVKAERRLLLLRQGRILREYPVSLGNEPLGHKQQEGDGRTPEGRYRIDWRNDESKFHLSLHITYPSEDDTAAAAARGVSPGGDIMIHGLPNGLGWLDSHHLARDWTQGCIAVTNGQIEEIWRVVPDGTMVEIRP